MKYQELDDGIMVYTEDDGSTFYSSFTSPEITRENIEATIENLKDMVKRGKISEDKATLRIKSLREQAEKFLID